MTSLSSEAAPAPIPLRVESRDDVARRLQTELPIVFQEPPEGTSCVKVYPVAYPKRDGSYDTQLLYREPLNTVPLDVESPSTVGLKGRIEDEIRQNSGLFDVLTTLDGRWWQDSPAEEDVETSLNEVLRLTVHDEAGNERVLDVLNCADGELTDQERAAIVRTIQKVGNFTQGKIYSRLNGIVFCSDSAFKDQELGSFHPVSGVMRLNLGQIRDAAGMLPPRYNPYFKGRTDVTAMDITLAHESGHIMGVRYEEEVDKHSLRQPNYAASGLLGMTIGYSAFNNIPSWEWKQRKVGEHWAENDWRHNDTIGAELGEHPPTSYGHKEPDEDEGESFGIVSLDGDATQLRMRQKIISETIERATGTTMEGRQTVSIKKVIPEGGIYRPSGRLAALQVVPFLHKT
jgi:hypothetical protein